MLLSKVLTRPLLEPDKREGVRYALTKEGVELAVVDITHPAFALVWSEEKQSSLEARFVSQNAAFERLPGWFRRLSLGFHLRGSLLARGIRHSRGGYLSGLGTYLLKLGPDNLPSQLAARADREIAASLPATAVRLRMQDIAQLTAEVAFAELAEAHAGQPLHLLNIGAGTAIDSLNALLILQRDRPALLERRRVVIQALDLDEDASDFGRNVLDALRPRFNGLEISLRWIRFDWTAPWDLRAVLEQIYAEHAVVIASSEGGLFEYGSDKDIVENLAKLRAHARNVPVVGSVTRNDALTRSLHRASGAAVQLRGLDEFARLTARAGYRVARVVQRPLSDQVILGPDSSSGS